MELMKLPQIHPLSFDRMRRGSIGYFIDRDFLLGHDPYRREWLATVHHPVNIREEQEYYELEMPVSGYTRDQINVDVKDNVLTIKGKRDRDEAGHSKYILREHDTDSFDRSFELAPVTDEDRITAKLKDGVLYVRLPRIDSLPYTGKPQNIPVF